MINWFNHLYPYSNLHELNLDWVIATVKNGEKEIADFIGVNTIKYANPILWNIESQYEANTVVVDGQTGNAYISVKAVPSGVHINHTEYWTQIYNYANVVDTLREQIAHNEGDTTTATQPFAVGDLVFVKTLLYRVIAPMIAGDSFVENSNIVKTTIEDELKANIRAIQSEASARQSADTQLQNNIDAEASARQSADTQLQSNIDSEVSARQSADTQLQSNIDSEVSTRQSADTQLQTNINSANTNISEIRAQVTKIENSIASIIYDIIVDINGNGDYTSLATAVSNANDGDRIYVCAGTYNNEVVNCIGKKLMIIGEDVNTTIIQNNYDDYYRPPINIGKGLISNITFKSTGTNGTTHAYSVHIDNSDLYGETLTFDNCNFGSASTASVGIGTRNDGKLIFNNCIIETTNSTASALFVHPSGIESEGGNNQLIYLIDCIIHCVGANVIHIQKVGNSSNNTYVTCIGCVLQTDTLSRKDLIYQNLYQTTSEGAVYFVRGAGNSYPILNQDTFVPGQEIASGRYNNQTIKTFITTAALTGGTQKSISLPSDCQLITNVSGIFDDTASGISYVIGSKAQNTNDSHDVYWTNSSKKLYAYSTYDSSLTVKIEYISNAESYL